MFHRSGLRKRAWTWFQAGAGSTIRPRTPVQRGRLRLEELENRLAPAVQLLFDPATQVLTLTDLGRNPPSPFPSGPIEITISETGPDSLLIDLNGDDFFSADSAQTPDGLLNYNIPGMPGMSDTVTINLNIPEITSLSLDLNLLGDTLPGDNLTFGTAANPNIDNISGRLANITVTDARLINFLGVLNMTQVSTVVQGGTKLTGNVALSATESISLPAGSGILAADGDVTLEANRFFTANPAAGSTGIQLTDAVIQTLGSGNIRLEGVGASVAAGTDRHGVNISSAGTGSLVQAIGTGSVTILGIAGAGTNFNSGVRIIGPNTQVTTASGNLTLEGTGQGSGFANNGVAITNATVEVGGDITITGISSFAAGANNGVNLGATGPVRMVARNISITGTSVPSDAINFVNAQLNATNQITLTGDSMALAAASTIFAGNNVRIRQKTVGGHIALGGAIPGTFVIPNALLDAISTSIVTVGEQSPDIATSSIRFAAAIGPFTGFNTLALNTTGLVTRLPGVGPLTINTLAIKAGQGVGTGALAFSTVARNLAVEAGSVGVYLTNLGPLSLMSLAAAGIQGFVSTGPISITTTTGATPGRLEVQTNMTSRQGPITLRTTDAATPGQDIVVAPRVAIRSWKKNILLQAGDNLTLNPGAVLIAQEKAGAPMANVFLNVDYSSTDAGVGGVANLTGQLPLAIARGLTITGGPQGDQFNVSPFNPKPNTHPPTPIVVNGAGGSDRMTVALPTGTIFHSGGTSIPSGTVIVHNPPAIGGNAKISYVNLEFPVTITRLANVRPVIGAAGPVANQPVSLSTAAVINPLGNVFISDPDTQAMLITVRIASGAVLGDFLGAVASGWTLQPPTHPTNIVYTRTVMGANVGALAQSAVRNLKFRPFATTAVGQKIVFTVTVNDGSGNVANTFEISAVVTP